MRKFSKIASAASLMAMLLPLAASARNFSGTVSAINGSSIVLTEHDGSNVNVDASGAKVLRRFGAPLPVDQIQSGDSLTVNGSASAEGQVNAKSIRDNSQKQRNATFAGVISSVTGSGFVITVRNRPDQTVATDANTIFKKNGQTAASSDLQTQMNVTVSGLWDSTANTIAATRVSIVIRTVTVTGYVTAVSGNTITLSKTAQAPAPITPPTPINPPIVQPGTVQAQSDSESQANLSSTATTGTVWTVDATNAKFVRRFGAAMLITDIQNGDRLQVTGQIIGTNITAKTVRNLSLQHHNGTFIGTISNVGATSFTLSSKNRGDQTINVTDKTVFKLGTATSTLADLKTGMTVTVSGVWDRTNSNVTASRITVRLISISIQGTLQSASDSTLTVATAAGTTYTVDATKARIRTRKSSRAALTDLVVNDTVRVSGRMLQGTTNITATEVRDLSMVSAATGTTTPTANNESNENETENEHGTTVTPPAPAPAPATTAQ